MVSRIAKALEIKGALESYLIAEQYIVGRVDKRLYDAVEALSDTIADHREDCKIMGEDLS